MLPYLPTASFGEPHSAGAASEYRSSFPLFLPMRWPHKQGTLTNGCYCRDGEEERPTVVPLAQASGVSLEGYAALVGLDDTLQRDNNMRSHKPL